MASSNKKDKAPLWLRQAYLFSPPKRIEAMGDILAFSKRVSDDFGIRIAIVQGVIEREIEFATQHMSDINHEYVRADVIQRCRNWLQKGAYSPLMESDKELLFAVATLRTAPLFFGMLYEIKKRGKIIDGGSD
jgi:hypothetical protein